MCMQVNPNSGIANDFHLRYFHMCGRVLGKALMDGQITPVHLVQPMYKVTITQYNNYQHHLSLYICNPSNHPLNHSGTSGTTHV